MQITKSLITITVLAVSLGAAQRADTKRAQGLMQAAQAKETVGGDLKAAIELYRQASRAAGADRALAAQALLRVGDCQERLGQAEARRTYEQVVKEYGDQTEWAARARAKLAPAAEPAGMSLRSYSPAGQGCMPQPLGSKWTDCHRPEGIVIRNLQTGEERLIVPKSQSVGRFIPGAISPDERILTYFDLASGLRAVNIDGSADRLLMELGVLFGGLSESAPLLYGLWTKDSRRLIVGRAGQGPSKNQLELVTISMADGKTQLLRTVDADLAGGGALSPDEKYIALRASRGGQDLGIVVAPLAGGDVVAATGTERIHRLVGWHPSGRLLYTSDRSAGAMGIWGIRMENGKPAGQPELAHSGIHPQVRPWVGRGGAIHFEVWGGASLVQTATIDAKNGRLSAPKATTKLYATGNWSPDYSLDGKKMLYASAYGPATVKVVVQDLATGKEAATAIPYRSVGNVYWDADGSSLLLHALKDRGEKWLLYRFNPATGESKVVSQSEAPQVSSRAGQQLYFAEGDATPGTLRRIHLGTGESGELKLPVQADALLGVAVSTDGRQVAYAYLAGNVGGSNPLGGIVRLETATLDGGRARVLFEQPRAKMRGGAAMTWTADGKSLLYGLPSGEQGTDIWLLSGEGGEPKKLASFPEQVLRVSAHPNGSEIALATRENSGSRFWVIENAFGRRN